MLADRSIRSRATRSPQASEYAACLPPSSRSGTSCGNAYSIAGISAMRAAPLARKSRRDLGHETTHFVAHLRRRLQAEIEIEDHLVETRSFDFGFQRVGDLRRVADQHRVLVEILGLHRAIAIDDLDEVAIVLGRGVRIAGESRRGAFLVI